MNTPSRYNPAVSYSAIVKTPPRQRRQATPAPFARHTHAPSSDSDSVPAFNPTRILADSSRPNLGPASAGGASLSSYSLKRNPQQDATVERDFAGFAVPYPPSSATSFTPSVLSTPVMAANHSASSARRTSNRPEPFFHDYFALPPAELEVLAAEHGYHAPPDTSRVPSIELLDSLRVPEPAAAAPTTTANASKRKRTGSRNAKATAAKKGKTAATSSTNHPLSQSASERERAAAAHQAIDLSDEDASGEDDESVKADPKGKGKQCVWQPYEDLYKAETLLEARRRRTAGQAGFKATTYQQIADWCNAQPKRLGAEKTASAVASRYQHLKSKYYEVFAYLLNRSGAGWDDNNHTPTLPDSAWEDLAASTNRIAQAAGKFRNRSWPLYPLYREIVAGNIAIGTHARVPGQPRPARDPRPTGPEDEDGLVTTEVDQGPADEDDLPGSSSSSTAAHSSIATRSSPSATAVRQVERAPAPNRRQQRNSLQATAFAELSSVGRNLLNIVETTARQSMDAVNRQLEQSGVDRMHKAYQKLTDVAGELNLSSADQEKIEYFLMFTMNDNRHLDAFLACPPSRLHSHVAMLLKAAKREDTKWTGRELE